MFRLFRHYIDAHSLVLYWAEIFYLFIQSSLIYYIFMAEDMGTTANIGASFSALVAIITTTAMACVGLYNRQHFVELRDVLSRAIVILPVVFLLLIAGMFVWDLVSGAELQAGNYLFCFATLVSFFPVLLGWRGAFIEIIDRNDGLKRRVLILGSGKRAAKIEELSRNLHNRAITIVGYVRLGAAPAESAEDEAPHPKRRTAERRPDFWVEPCELPAFCAEKKVEEIVVAIAERRGLPVRDLLACKFGGIQMTEYATFWERESGEVDLEEISPSWILFSDGFRVGAFRSFVKRAFDITVSAMVLFLTLPITIPTAVLIKLESKGPIFYRQERVGLGGRSFMVLKFRSMSTDAEKDGPRWAAKNDNRVTRIGAFIRKVRIDEIPQVINVLKGNMAFVGPRPERPVFVKALAEKIPYYNERHVAKPGITGWAQVNYPYGATEHDARMKLAYDLYYIKNGSLFLDVIILMQTVKVLLWNDGAR